MLCTGGLIRPWYTSPLPHPAPTLPLKPASHFIQPSERHGKDKIGYFQLLLLVFRSTKGAEAFQAAFDAQYEPYTRGESLTYMRYCSYVPAAVQQLESRGAGEGGDGDERDKRK